MDRIKNLLRALLGVPLTVVSLLFITNFIYKSRREILPQLTNFNEFGVLIGIIFLGLFFILRSIAWRQIMIKEGFRMPGMQSAYLLATSELKRYVPGSILAFVSRIHNFGKFKIPTKSVLRMIFIENIIFVLTSFSVSIPALFFIAAKNNIDQNISNFVFLIIPTGLVLTYLSKKTSKIIKQAYEYSDAFILMMLAWILFGVGNYLIFSSFYFFDPKYIAQISSLSVLSWLIGYIVVIAPLGLGVREAFLTYALSFFSPIGLAAALAIIGRVCFTLAELLFLGIVFILHKSIKVFPKIELTTGILWTAILSYIFYFTYYSFEKYNSFFMGRFDLGNMDQTVWNTLHGRIFQLTNPYGINSVSRLSFHSDFILILLAPFYILWEDPRMLLLIQTVVIAFGAYFVYKISEQILEQKYMSLVFAISYLLNPFIQKQNLFDFHPVTLSTTFLLVAFYFILKKKNLYFAIALFLAVITKEQIFAIAGLLLLYVFYRDRNLKWLLFSFLSFILFYLMVSKFIPDARGGQHFAAEYFQDFGDTPGAIIQNLIFEPAKTASVLFTRPNFDYLFKLLLPAGFTSLAAPIFLIFALPDLLINLISKNENLKSLTFHYAAAIVPFIYISAIYGVKKLISVKLLTLKSATVFLSVSSLVSAYFYGTLPGAARPSLEIYTGKPKTARLIQDFLKTIPAELSVAASNNLGSHLSQREKIYTLSAGINEADVVVFLLNDEYAAPSLSEQRRLATELKYDNRYIELYTIDGFIAYSKIDAAKFIMRNSIKSNAF